MKFPNLSLAVALSSATALLAGCGGARDPDADPSDYYDRYEREEFNESAVRSEVEQQLADEGYDGRDGCEGTCAGEEAGWDWRAENGYATDGNSDAFSAGGRSFDDALDDEVERRRQEFEAEQDELEADYDRGSYDDY